MNGWKVITFTCWRKTIKMDALIQVEKIVKINEDKQNAFLRTFPRLPIDERIEVMVTHRKLIHKFKQVYSEISISILSYSALVMSMQIFLENQDKFTKLNISDLQLPEIYEITAKRAKLFLYKQTRNQSKRERLLSYWAVVKTLKNEEKFSFRKIAVYLKKYHKLDVSYSLIAKTWIEIEKKDEKNG